MSCYFIANIKLKDETEYRKYIDRSDSVFRKHNGEYLCVDNNPVLLEGSWNYSRCVVIRFNSKEDFNAWYYSDEYQAILKHRLNGAECDSILAEG